MKKLSITQLAIFLTVALLATPLWAARASNVNNNKAENMGLKTQGALGLSQMLDKTVKDQKGNDLGQIEDVVISSQGQALYGILAGPSNKYYPIPMRTLLKSVKEDHFVLINVSSDNFSDKAPGFSRGDWPTELTGRDWEQKVFSYYGEQSSGGTMGQTGGASNMGTTTQPKSGQ